MNGPCVHGDLASFRGSRQHADSVVEAFPGGKHLMAKAASRTCKEEVSLETGGLGFIGFSTLAGPSYVHGMRMVSILFGTCTFG